VGNHFRRPKDDTGPRIKSHSSSDISPQQQVPAFCFQHQRNGYQIGNCCDEAKVALADAIHRRSNLTWQQIETADHHKLGTEKIPQVRLHFDVPSSFPEEAKVTVLRCQYGVMRLIGFREGRTFHVVWVDEKGAGYDHGD
jgi:hypothetical protein